MWTCPRCLRLLMAHSQIPLQWKFVEMLHLRLCLFPRGSMHPKTGQYGDIRVQFPCFRWGTRGHPRCRTPPRMAWGLWCVAVFLYCTLCPDLCPFSGVVSRNLSKFLYRILSLCLREPNLRLLIREGSLGKILKQNLGARSPTSLLVMSPSSRMASQALAAPHIWLQYYCPNFHHCRCNTSAFWEV